MMDVLRLELAGEPIRVITIAPGMVKTEGFALTRFAGDQSRVDALYKDVDRPLSAADVAEKTVQCDQAVSSAQPHFCVQTAEVAFTAPHHLHHQIRRVFRFPRPLKLRGHFSRDPCPVRLVVRLETA